jgi:hypothetical protein
VCKIDGDTLQTPNEGWLYKLDSRKRKEEGLCVVLASLLPPMRF